MRSGIRLAEQRIAEGKYAEAEAICREILGDRYDPNFRPAAQLLARLQQPGYFNRTQGQGSSPGRGSEEALE